MKIFREPVTARHQLFFLPPSLDELVPQDAAVRLLSDAIDAMDCSELLNRYRGGGAPAYHPLMLLKILFQGYSEGIRSSRKLAERCVRDTHYMFLTGMSRPDHRTICRFRRDNEAVVKTLFLETITLCQAAGLVLLEHVAVDGTKIEASVSSKETYNPARAEKAIAHTKACIEAILKEAEAQDTSDDATDDSTQETGPGTSGKDKTALVRKLKRRLERAEAAKKQMKESGSKAACATDLESRVMKTTSGSRPAYNAQAAVDGANHVIVAALITQQNNDGQQLEPVITSVIENTGRKPAAATADCGYNTPKTLIFAEEAGIEAYIAERLDQKVKAEFFYDASGDVMRRPAATASPGDPAGGGEGQGELVLRFHAIRTKDGTKYRVYRDSTTGKEMWVREDPELEMRLRNEMHARMTSADGKAIYRLRKETVEPVFGRLKAVFGLRRLLLRGIQGANIEYLLACAAHNFRKLAGARLTGARQSSNRPIFRNMSLNQALPV